MQNIADTMIVPYRRCRYRRKNKKAMSIEELITRISKPSYTFIDLFAGCGGLSLGLMNAGWMGLFAVEKEENAFETLHHNLISRSTGPRYAWPDWLESGPSDISKIITNYRKQLIALRGYVDLIAGGPPCQGFSLAGRRKKADPRNRLFIQYMRFVKIVQPRIVIMENVKGITIEFGKKRRDSLMGRARGRRAKPFADRIRGSLEKIGYTVIPTLLKAVDFGVPQLRPRYFLIGVRRPVSPGFNSIYLQNIIDKARTDLLKEKGLPINGHVSSKEALSDLEVGGKRLIDCTDTVGFQQIEYGGPQTHYQRLMHDSMNGVAPNSLRLANHRENTVYRFRKIIETCRPGVSLSDDERARLRLGKHCVVALDPHRPSHTLTTLPDDIIHYSEPRILTVRECARLQSFPDWFEFRGKYTTGGERRVHECPRYTQVGNAVPPLLGEAIGKALVELLANTGAPALQL